LLVQFDETDKQILIEWKRLCLFLYGQGGIKKRTSELVREDCKKLKKEKG